MLIEQGLCLWLKEAVFGILWAQKNHLLKSEGGFSKQNKIISLELRCRY
jgi:hypothetical protein